MMKSLVARLKTAFSGDDFLLEKHFCERELASQRFKSALIESRKKYGELKLASVSSGLVHENWLTNISKLESYFLNQMNEAFVSNKVISDTMVFADREVHKLELKNILDVFDKSTVEEIVSKGLNTAFLPGSYHRASLINSTHHFYHLMRFEQRTGKKIKDIKSIVEFGGGYGNMARIVQNVGSFNSYTIVDLLLFSCIQYVFLSTVSGNDKVAFDGDNKRANAKFILHPLFRTDLPTNMHGELFLSTWALSEGTRAAYDWVVSCDWFGASSILLAYDKHWQPWHEDELDVLLTSNGWHIEKEPILFLPGSVYLFATRR